MELIVGIILAVSGIISCGLSCVIVYTILKKNLLQDKSYLMILNLCVSFIVKILVVGYHRWLMAEAPNCEMTGFTFQLMTAYQVEALTHLCIERYVVAKYKRNGWDVTISRYMLFLGICVFFSSLYSLLPLYGTGEYTLHMTTSTCQLGTILPEIASKKYLLIAIFVLQSFKPVLIMIGLLSWASEIEEELRDDETIKTQMDLTASTKTVTSMTLLFWSGSFVVTAWEVLHQMMYDEFAEVPHVLVVTAAILTELAPAAAALSIMKTNKTIRDAMSNKFVGVEHDKQM